MAVEFSEYQGKRKRKREHRRFPLIRIIIVFALIIAAYTNGWFRMLVDKLPLPGNEEPVAPVVEDWIAGCTAYDGTPFELKDGFAQCSWIVTDSLALPNTFLRYVKNLSGDGAKIHWVASKKDFGDALLVVQEDSTRNVFLHMTREDSSKVWISSKTGCLFPGPCPHVPLGWSALSIVDNFDFEGQEALISADVFSGLGEAPVYPVLPGIVLEAGRDSLGMFVEGEWFGHDGALKTAALLNPKRHAVWLWMMQCEYPGRINRWHQYKVWRPVVNKFFEQNTGKGSNGETP